MPNNSEHNKICVRQRYDKKMCDSVNRWMDAPASLYPGCQHRNFRHNRKDCDSLANETLRRTGNIEKAKEAREICMLHRIVDRKTDGCGCKPLFQD